jgi:hypothetical protein
MELSPFQRFAAFVVVVLVLAGLVAYLFLPRWSSAADRHRGTNPGSASQAATQLPSSPAASGTASPDIYQWLPFTQSGLASAAGTTTAFAGHYGTYSYAESTQAYLSPMRPLMTTQLAMVLGQAFAAPGLAGNRAASKQTATATAAILSLRAFGPSSLTFVVALTQRIASTKGTSTQTTDYAITLTGNGSSWQVSDIQLSSAGNQ